MELGLREKVACVAAATSGLGLAAAREFVREGARVAICGRDPGRLESARTELEEAAGGRADAVLAERVDLSTPEGPARFIRAAEGRFGSVDVVIANNGGPRAAPLLELGDADWEDGFVRTFQSARRLVEAALPGMRARRWGRILFITSVSVKQPLPRLGISSAMRCAVVAYAKTLADDLASEGITVNCLAPGSIATPRLEELFASEAKARSVPVEEIRRSHEARIPARRIGLPEEFAAALVFLASERASYMTGTVLPVDGGLARSIV